MTLSQLYKEKKQEERKKIVVMATKHTFYENVYNLDTDIMVFSQRP